MHVYLSNCKINELVHEDFTDINLLDPRFKQGYDYTKLAIQSLIETSPDGIIITDESREEAKELTKNRFN